MNASPGALAAALTGETYAAEDIARAGAFVALGSDGEARIERGYLRPEDERRHLKTNDDDMAPEASDAGGSDGLSAALVAELTAHRTAALRNDLAQAPELGLIAVTHALAAGSFYRGDSLSCLQITAKHNSLSACAPGFDESGAELAVSARHQAWQARLPESGEALWSFIVSLAMDDLLSLLAHCASLTLDAVQRPNAHSQGDALAHAGILAQAMPHVMSRYWQPTAANYLARVGKDRIFEAVNEGAGEEAARQIAGLKKQAMVVRAEQLLAGKDWLPELLRIQSGD
jgi:ParB family chromosome partitioning protein